MSRHQHSRKRAFRRGTFLLVDGEKYDVSNIVHDSTEAIPDEIAIVIRRSTLPTNLYPCLDTIKDSLEHSSDDDDASLQLQQHVQRRDSESLSSRESRNHTNDDTSVVHDNDDGSWSRRHQSLSSTNWTPPEKKQILKMVELSGGRAQVPGAVHVGMDDDHQQHLHLNAPLMNPPSINRQESMPGSIHVDAYGIHGGDNDAAMDMRRNSLDYKPPADVMDSTSKSPAATAQHNTFSMNSYIQQESSRAALREPQQQQYAGDDDSWNSAQIRAAAAAFDPFQLASPQQQSEVRMVHVTDDLELPLHGASETTAALESGQVVTAVCIVCRATLRCIRKAQYVLCPECKCLTPLQDTHYNATGGVGLGLLSTYDQSFRVGISS